MWIERDFVRPPEELLKGFRGLSTGNLSDAMGRMQGCDAGIAPLAAGWRLCGPAFTVQCIEACNWGAHHALSMARAGDVLILSNRGAMTSAVWGHVMTTAAKRAGLGGVVVDGCVRDADENRADTFPIFARGIAPAGPHKNWPCSINVPVSCGGVAVLPGDIVVGDGDGIVIVPARRAEEVLRGGVARREIEQEWYRRIGEGATTVEILNLDPIDGSKDGG
jgi:4-hydroxy-4-methyl-2-oxoglutarate aldolase